MKQSQINALNILRNVSGDDTADLLEKAMGHKYFKREGSPGNYKYYYTEEQYNKEKGKKTEENKGKKSPETIEKDGKKYKLQPNGKYLEVSEQGMTSTEHVSESIRLKEAAWDATDKGLVTKESIKLDEEGYKHSDLAGKTSNKEFTKEELEDKGKQMNLKSNWDKMSLKERDKFLESFKKDRPDDYKLLNTSIINLSANNFEAWSEKQQDLLSSYYMFEFID